MKPENIKEAHDLNERLEDIDDELRNIQSFDYNKVKTFTIGRADSDGDYSRAAVLDKKIYLDALRQQREAIAAALKKLGVELP